jgi:hypothetical protein
MPSSLIQPWGAYGSVCDPLQNGLAMACQRLHTCISASFLKQMDAFAR